MADVVKLSDREAMARASKAQALLNDPELNAAFEAVKNSIHDRIDACPIRDVDGLVSLRLQLKLLNDVKANLQSVVSTGKVIQDRLTWLERAKRKVNGW